MPKKSVKKTAKKAAVKKAALKKAVVKKAVKKFAGRGGARPGAGRPKGTGKYGAPTKAVRVPIHLIDKIKVFIDKEIAAEQKAKK